MSQAQPQLKPKQDPRGVQYLKEYRETIDDAYHGKITGVGDCLFSDGKWYDTNIVIKAIATGFFSGSIYTNIYFGQYYALVKTVHEAWMKEKRGETQV